MFTPLMLRMFAFRFAVMKFGGSALFDWDYKTGELIESHNFFKWNYIMNVFGGFVYCSSMCLRQIFVLYEDNEEDLAPEDVQHTATTLIGFGEATVTFSITLICLLCALNRTQILRLINDILKHDKEMLELLTENGKKLDKKHLLHARVQEFVILVINVLSLVLPLFLALTPAHPMEATGRLIKALLEVELELSLKSIPIFFVLYTLIISAGNGVGIVVLLAQAYLGITTIGLHDIKPKALASGSRMEGTRHQFETTALGKMTDDQVIQKYRHQQVYNVHLNEIIAHVMVSTQNVACLMAVVSIAYFGIVYFEIVLDEGILGILIVAGALATPLVIQFLEAHELGQVYENSVTFRSSGGKLVGRKSLYGKFLLSCKPFFVEEAYPFYHIQKETFMLFCEQCTDYTAELLLT